MLIYSKKSGTPEELHLYGTLKNEPSENDAQLVYRNIEGELQTPSLSDLYFDNGKGSMKWVKDGVDQGQLNVFIIDPEVLPEEAEPGQQLCVIPKDFKLVGTLGVSMEYGDIPVGTPVADSIQLMWRVDYNDGSQDDEPEIDNSKISFDPETAPETEGEFPLTIYYDGEEINKVTATAVANESAEG